MFHREAVFIASLVRPDDNHIFFISTTDLKYIYQVAGCFLILHILSFQIDPVVEIAEALGLGANVVAFIGLAGQVIQGCQYIKTILDDVKDAPDDIRSLHTEINLLTRTLETFKNALVELSHSETHVEIGGEAKLALDYCEEAIAGLLKSILKIKRPGSKWGQIKFAFSKDKVSKHIGRVERAKGYIATAQASILL
jgi:hypothetical protein